MPPQDELPADIDDQEAIAKCARVAGAEEDEEEAAVLIAAPEHDIALRPLVINLRDAAVEGEFDRVLEVVPADESARAPSRERWKQYAARGLEVSKHDM